LDFGPLFSLRDLSGVGLGCISGRFRWIRGFLEIFLATTGSVNGLLTVGDIGRVMGSVASRLY
jgi:hypothetical protein